MKKQTDVCRIIKMKFGGLTVFERWKTNLTRTFMAPAL